MTEQAGPAVVSTRQTDAAVEPSEVSGQALTRLAQRHGIAAVVLLMSSLAVLFCYTAYLLIDPGLFEVPIAVWMPIAAPIFAAPLLTYENIRSRVKLAEIQEAARRRAEALAAEVAEKDRVLSLIGHDLAGHIALVTGFSAELRKLPPGDPRQSDFIAEIGNAGDAANNVLNDLLAWGRLSVTAAAPVRGQTDLRQLVDQVLDLMRSVATAAGVRLDADGPPITAYADARQIETALRNLVANAIRYTPIGGEVVVTVAEPDEGQVSLSVRDTGSGFDQRAFEGARMGSGHGLGLATCREIATRHGGSLSIDSRTGRGTTVTLSFPRTPTDPSA